MSAGSPRQTPEPQSPEPSGSPRSPTGTRHRRRASEQGHPPSTLASKPRLWPSDLPKIPLKPGTHNELVNPSIAPNSELGQLSPGVTDRVFPIRSVVSVDPNPTPHVRPESNNGDGFPVMVPPSDGGGNSSQRFAARRSSIASATGTADQASEPAIPEPAQKPRRGTPEAQKSLTFEALSEGRRGCGSVTGNVERSSGTRQVQIFNDASSINSEEASSIDGGPSIASGSPSVHAASVSTSVRSIAEKDNDTGGGVLTARFKHIVTDGGHAVITGRDGDTLQRCEDEPIHIPGAVQGFGLLIALHEESEGKLSVRIVSENSKRLIGYTPKQLFALESFCDILSEEQADNLFDHLDFIRDEDSDPATNGPDVFTLSIRSPQRKLQKLWCAIHHNEKNHDLIICEFELEEDPLNPLVPAADDTPEPPEDTLNSDPTTEEIAESTQNVSKPLRVLRSARKRKGEAAAMEVFNIMSQVQEQMANAPTLERFLKVLVGVVKELTGFHRVMIYQFDHTFNGRVVTELVDPRATKDLYKGLNFPASDIPKQARDLYKINKVRILYDRDQETARLVCRTLEDLENPLDLSFAYLRAMSPVHLKYLANMAVRSSMSISINAFGELWGLIACHTYGSRGMRVSFPIRKMCRVVGDTASRNIERLSYASRLQARKLINTSSTEHNPSGYIIASSDDLLTLFDADFGLLSIRGETKFLGRLEASQEGLAMLEYLRLRKMTSVMSSQDIKEDFPDLRYNPGFQIIAGLLLVPLSGSGNDFIVFFRKGQLREVKWAGNPYEKFIKEGTEGYLEPRKSFNTWSETVIGKCREWTEEQIETAAVLCLVYGKFIDVWRQKEAALQSSQLTKLLLSNSAHEVRTPLNAIINYLEIALEGSLDSETRENLAKSHSASKSLIYVINDLLDLTKTEEGHELVKDEVFDLPATIREATDAFRGDAKRKQIDFDLIENSGVPQLVIGDQRRVRQAVSNVTANAIQHTSLGGVKVELWLTGRVDGRAEVDIVIQDTGTGMSSQKLDALFRGLEQVESEGDEICEENFNTNAKQLTTGKEDKHALGLGLAVVARLIRNMNGQLRLKSEEGKGSRFVIQLAFDLPTDQGNKALPTTSSAPYMMQPSNIPMSPPATEGEMMLVPKGSVQKIPRDTSALTRKNSTESVNSIKSTHSFNSQLSGKSAHSAKSDVDRLLNAIQDPHISGKPEGDDSLTRPTSRGSGNAQSRRPVSASSTRRMQLSRGHSYSVRNMSVEGSPAQAMPGQEHVTDSRTPLRPVKMPEDFPAGSPPNERPFQTPSRVLFEIPDKAEKKQPEPPNADHLNVLVAEDDPVNSRIIKKRLETSGHVVYLTVNGEECSSAYGEKPGLYDVVLMDIQMPIVDGLTSTQMIRSYEKSHQNIILSSRASLNGRVPVFAVSASLVERERDMYIDGGFDGWILKPIDFKRLNYLLAGIVEEDSRNKALYRLGEWEKGGWFKKRQPDVFAAQTAPSGKTLVTKPPHNPLGRTFDGSSQDPFDDPISEEQDRLDHFGSNQVGPTSQREPQQPSEEWETPSTQMEWPASPQTP
ncbi:MAG: Light-sensor Protein kinase [Pycnora praestabilis]|nr:MAG: Light-sensor Protein kinase [Pycnora praestabilis]